MSLFGIKEKKEILLLRNTLETNRQQTEKLDEENNRLINENAKLNSLVTDEHGQARDIKEELKKLTSQILIANFISLLLQRKTHLLSAEHSALEAGIVELNEAKLLQDYGLYEPTYTFASSREYKVQLDEIRKQQKQMIKDKTAAICPTEWLVNESRREGKRMINNNIKSIILTFNTECESAISRVKFNNFDSMLTRISLMYYKLNELNAPLQIALSHEFLDLKIQELTLAHEYALKQKEEKEYIREQREIQRENARVQREIEQEQRRIEKEQAHYQNQLHRLVEQLNAEDKNARKTLIQEKIDAAKAELIDLEKALKDIDYRKANERAGYVYIISNIGSFGENVYKIGMTRRLEPLDRINELGGASVPFRFDVHALIFSDDAPKLETALHNAFADRRVNMINGRKEFFKVPLSEIEAVVKKNHDRTVEFSYLPEAEQYRNSLRMYKQ